MMARGTRPARHRGDQSAWDRLGQAVRTGLTLVAYVTGITAFLYVLAFVAFVVAS